MNFFGFGKNFLKSRKLIEKQQKEFEKKIFPFEERQKNLVAVLLKELLDPKLNKQDILYAFICAKQAYIEADPEQNAVLVGLSALAGQSWISKKDAGSVVALVVLDASLVDIAVFPTKADVVAKAQEIKHE